MGSVRFVSDPLLYTLDSLHDNDAEDVLTRRTAPRIRKKDESAKVEMEPVVLDPESGWSQLRDRLKVDLQSNLDQGTERNRFVLPARLKGALEGLRTLRWLTVAEYERGGGLAGMEMSHVKRHVIGASGASQLRVEQVRKVLLSLIDPKALAAGNPEGLTTISRQFKKLVNALRLGTEQQPLLKQCLDYLVDRGLVRRQIQPDTLHEQFALLP